MRRPPEPGPGILDDDRGLLLVTLENLLAVADPLSGDTWSVGTIGLGELREDRSAQHSHSSRYDASEPVDLASLTSSASTPEQVLRQRLERVECRGCHVERIRFLAEHGWPDAVGDRHPVTVDVGLGDGPPRWFPLVDGNHRVAAATMRGERLVEVSVGGDWDLACDLLLKGLPWP